jgi:IS5 family transposase
MIINHYERPVGIAEPKVSDPLLQELDGRLADPELLALVRQDLKQHYSRLRRGRPPVPVEVPLRMTVLRRRKRWSYRQTEQEVRDSPPYRWWVRVYDHPVPDHTTLNDLERLIQPKTLHRLNDRLLRLAQDCQLTKGDRLRVDSSVTESNIHYPTDSSLLVDGVRLLSRLLKRAKPWLAARMPEAAVFSDHTRRARRRARRIGQLVRPASVGRKQPGPAGAKKKPCTKPMPNLSSSPASVWPKLGRYAALYDSGSSSRPSAYTSGC